MLIISDIWRAPEVHFSSKLLDFSEKNISQCQLCGTDLMIQMSKLREEMTSRWWWSNPMTHGRSVQQEKTLWFGNGVFYIPLVGFFLCFPRLGTFWASTIPSICQQRCSTVKTNRIHKIRFRMVQTTKTNNKNKQQRRNCRNLWNFSPPPQSNLCQLVPSLFLAPTPEPWRYG